MYGLGGDLLRTINQVARVAIEFKGFIFRE